MTVTRLIALIDYIHQIIASESPVMHLNNSGTSDDDDKQLSVNESNWAELPSLIVEPIYSFLSRSDQYRMSLDVEIICKRVKTHLIGKMRIQLKLFLQAMTLRSQLTSIRFINMGNYFRHLDCDFNDDLRLSVSSAHKKISKQSFYKTAVSYQMMGLYSHLSGLYDFERIGLVIIPSRRVEIVLTVEEAIVDNIVSVDDVDDTRDV
ncbi:hypothetical protein AVEN_205364-1 [Araneus ventricosus]|uniref:Uncharacterized protein n=1 Tax=Araneus ventricosus TaxID=182803 RepID=A0A4Y2WII6_ARAVE|nr:hypothetical protein AVEN_205364-1 [Araneus ventricosus]